MKKNSGFTLIEILITVGLFGMVMAGSVGLFAMVIKNNQKTERLIQLRSKGDEAIQVINRAITNAKTLNSSTLDEAGPDPIIIGLDLDNGNGTQTLILCDPTNNRISYDIFNGSTHSFSYLGNGTNLDITNCRFARNFFNSYNVFEFTLSLANSQSNESQSFTTKAVMRNRQSE